MPDDKTDEPKRSVQQLDREHDELLRKSLLYLGRALLRLRSSRPAASE
jgi:hypothetical protein